MNKTYECWVDLFRLVVCRILAVNCSVQYRCPIFGHWVVFTAQFNVLLLWMNVQYVTRSTSKVPPGFITVSEKTQNKQLQHLILCSEHNFDLLMMSTWCSKHVEAWNKTYCKTKILCIRLVNYWDKYTEMHGQQNVKTRVSFVHVLYDRLR